jgi:hypothetical protein
MIHGAIQCTSQPLSVYDISWYIVSKFSVWYLTRGPGGQLAPDAVATWRSIRLLRQCDRVVQHWAHGKHWRQVSRATRAYTGMQHQLLMNTCVLDQVRVHVTSNWSIFRSGAVVYESVSIFNAPPFCCKQRLNDISLSFLTCWSNSIDGCIVLQFWNCWSCLNRYQIARLQKNSETWKRWIRSGRNMLSLRKGCLRYTMFPSSDVLSINAWSNSEWPGEAFHTSVRVGWRQIDHEMIMNRFKENLYNNLVLVIGTAMT